MTTGLGSMALLVLNLYALLVLSMTGEGRHVVLPEMYMIYSTSDIFLRICFAIMS